jgi:hypothetical protein
MSAAFPPFVSYPSQLLRWRALPLRLFRRQLLYMYNFYLVGFPSGISTEG